MDHHSQVMANSDGVSVHSGFPNPAAERRGQNHALSLDVNRLLVRHPSSTYLFRISGHLWADQGVHDGDIAVIDRAIAPRTGSLVIDWQDNGFDLFRYDSAKPQPWGVITAIVHQYNP